MMPCQHPDFDSASFLDLLKVQLCSFSRRRDGTLNKL